MPAAVAYMFYEFAVLTGVAFRLRSARAELIRVLYPKVHDAQLEHLFSPAALSFTQFVQTKAIRSNDQGIAAPIWNAASSAILVAVVLGVLTFLAYAYIKLFQRDGGSFLVWASCAFAAIAVAGAAGSVVDDISASQ